MHEVHEHSFRSALDTSLSTMRTVVDLIIFTVECIHSSHAVSHSPSLTHAFHLQEHLDLMATHGVRRVTFVVLPDADRCVADGVEPVPWIYTFRRNTGFEEDVIVRHTEAPLASHLELARLSNFRIRALPTPCRTVHVYKASAPDGSGAARFFVRATVRELEQIPLSSGAVHESFPGPERIFRESLEALSIALRAVATPPASHIFLNILPESVMNPDLMTDMMKSLYRQFVSSIRKLKVSTVEIR